MQHEPNDAGNCLLFICEYERMTGGAAVGDYDGDGWDDLFATRLDGPDLLFHNNGDGTFTDRAAEAGLTLSAPTNGALWVDVDRDGDLDLFITALAVTRFYLYINDGAGHFSEEGLARGAALDDSLFHTGWSIAAGDYDQDGWPDLFTAEWGSALLSGVPENHHVRLLRNLGPEAPGEFEDATDAAGVNLFDAMVSNVIWSFAPAFADLDRDGFLDLVLANDFGTSRIFWNNGNGTFTDGTTAANVGTDENGMGSTFGDYDGDGDLDWFVTSISDPADICAGAGCNWGTTGNRLFENLGNRVFADATDAAGVREGGWGWGTVFFDYDNDGDLDLTMTNGVDFPDSTAEAPFIIDPMRMWENDGTGQFTEVSVTAGLTDTRSGKGLLTFDYDHDGDLDLFVVNNGEQPMLLRNDGGNANGWLRVKFKGNTRAFEGLNAIVSLTPVMGGPALVREMGVASHFLGQSERVAHFGLGAAKLASLHEVRIDWPRSGEVQIFNDVTPNTTFEIIAPVAETGDPPPILPAAGVLALAILSCSAFFAGCLAIRRQIH